MSTKRQDAESTAFPRLSIFLLSLFCVGGCIGGRPANTDAIYQQASTDFLMERWSQAAAGFQTVRKRARGERRGEAAYWEGQCYAAMGHYSKAETRLREVSTLAVASSLQSRAALALARVRMKEGRHREALSQLKSLQYRRRDLDPAEVLALQAACERALKDRTALAATLKQLETMESPFAKQALQAHGAAFSHAVQVGAYRSKALAEAQQRKLTVAGFRTYIKQKNALYVVQTGVYRNRQTAETEVAKLRQRGFTAVIAATD